MTLPIDSSAVGGPVLRSQVTLQVESTPPGAEVVLGLTVLGTTPYAKRMSSVPGEAELELRLAGYVTKRIRVSTDKDEHRIIVLKAADR
jgi:hypothetical protein